MFAQYLTVIFLATLAVAEVPSYIKVCGRRNPNLDECVKESVESLREKLRTGMPEIDVPPGEPLILDEVPIIQTDTLKAVARDVQFFGLPDFEIRQFHIDLENQQISMGLFFEKVIFNALYDFSASVIVPLAGKGTFHLNAANVQADVILKYKVTKKDGVEKIFYFSMTTKLAVGKSAVEFKAADGTDATISTAITRALKDAQHEIFGSVRPAVEKAISAYVLKTTNKISGHFTYEELFPDRE